MMLMDSNTSLYEDNGLKMSNEAMKRKKSNMTLDFGNGPNAKRPRGKLGVLASPELEMCKLASPELEKLISQHNGIITTPTPGAPTPTQILFPKRVTEEQEAYARGFMDALAELWRKQDPSTAQTVDFTVAKTPKTDSVPMTSAPKFTTLQNVPPASLQPQFFTTVTSAPVNVLSVSPKPDQDERPSSGYSASVPATVIAHSPTPVVQQQYTDLSNQSSAHFSDYSDVHPRTIALKEEPQTVPSGYTPPVSPINMDEQEDKKTDRKRARNRVAARKCRFRKLERISRLETRVEELKGQNSALSQDALTLKDQVARLKQQIMEHVRSGCQIMVASGIGNIL